LRTRFTPKKSPNKSSLTTLKLTALQNKGKVPLEYTDRVLKNNPNY